MTRYKGVDAVAPELCASIAAVERFLSEVDAPLPVIGGSHSSMRVAEQTGTYVRPAGVFRRP
ncbi:hypothetical protein [Luteitalea sp.]